MLSRVGSLRTTASVALLAGLLIAALPPAPAAPAECVPVHADETQPLESLPGLPAGWTPFLSLSNARMPAVPHVAASGPAGECDITADVAAFATVAGVVDRTQLAELVIAATFPDHLGLPIAQTVAVDGNVARATSVSAKDGLVVDWTIQLRPLDARFVVLGRAPGADGNFEGYHPGPGFADGDVLTAGQSPGGGPKSFLCPNVDGTQFRFNYNTNDFASVAEADAQAANYCTQARAIWAIEVADWGLASADADDTYDILMEPDACNCIFAGNNVNIQVEHKLEDLLNLFNPALVYPSNEHFYRVVIGHEFHHHLQFSINQWRLGGALTEGGARFSETAFEPVGAHGPRTITYLNNINGFSSMMTTPNVQIADRLYNFGLFYGFIYSKDGGIDVLREVYEEALNVVNNENDGIPAAVTRALANMGAAAVHHSFAEAYADFTVAMYKKDFVWGKDDGADQQQWGDFLPNIVKSPMPANPAQLMGASNVAFGPNVVPGGILFVGAAREAPLVTEYAGDGALKAQWIWRDGDGVVQTHSADPVFVIAPGPVTDVTLALARGPAVLGNPMTAAFGAGNFRAAVQAPAQLV